MASRFKLFGYGILFCGLSIVLASLALSPSGHHWAEEHLPGANHLLATTVGTVIFGLVILGMAVLMMVIAYHTVKPGIKSEPVLIINKAGLWHNIVPLGPYDYKWEEIERVEVKKRRRGAHVSHLISLNLKNPESEPEQRRRGTIFHAGEVATHRDKIIESIRKNPPQIPVNTP